MSGSSDRHTQRGVPALPGTAPKSRSIPPDVSPEPGIAVELHPATGVEALHGAWCALEVWTQNHVYGLDAGAVCRVVRDLGSTGEDREHPIVGARLLGGQRRGPGGRIAEVSFPLPKIGSMAVFATQVGKRRSVSETSTVTRVVLRQRVVALAQGEAPTWNASRGGTWPPFAGPP